MRGCEWTVTASDVYEEREQIVNGAGKIVREVNYWCAAYTVSRPGYVDVDYCAAFTSKSAALAHVQNLMDGVDQ